jgi:hypothetical protein
VQRHQPAERGAHVPERGRQVVLPERSGEDARAGAAAGLRLSLMHDEETDRLTSISPHAYMHVCIYTGRMLYIHNAYHRIDKL